MCVCVCVCINACVRKRERDRNKWLVRNTDAGKGKITKIKRKRRYTEARNIKIKKDRILLTLQIRD